jgi:hypothetical protein
MHRPNARELVLFEFETFIHPMVRERSEGNSYFLRSDYEGDKRPCCAAIPKQSLAEHRSPMQAADVSILLDIIQIVGLPLVTPIHLSSAPNR